MRNFINMLKQHLEKANTNSRNNLKKQRAASKMLNNLLQNNSMTISMKEECIAFKLLLRAIERVAASLLQTSNKQIKAFCEIIYSEKLYSKFRPSLDKLIALPGGRIIFMYNAYCHQNISFENCKSASQKNIYTNSLIEKPLYGSFNSQDSCLILIMQFISGEKFYYGMHRNYENDALELYFGATSDSGILPRFAQTQLMLSIIYNIDIDRQLKLSSNQIDSAMKNKEVVQR